MGRECIVGVDLGATKIASVLAEPDGRILARVVLPTKPEDGAEAVATRVCASIQAVISRCGESICRIQGVGIGSPGVVDAAAGVVVYASNLHWEYVPLADLVGRRLGLPVFLENDANCAALGETTFGTFRGVRNMCYMVVGTGVGGAIISDGRILRGASGGAGEMGHIIVERDGRPCSCGAHGCIEAYASGPAIQRRFIERIKQGYTSKAVEMSGGDLESVSCELIAKAASLGDQLCCWIIEETGSFLGIAVSTLINLLNPEVVLFGGGISAIGDSLIDSVRRTVRERALTALARTVTIATTSLGADAGTLGAVALVLEEKEKHK